VCVGFVCVCVWGGVGGLCVCVVVGVWRGGVGVCVCRSVCVVCVCQSVCVVCVCDRASRSYAAVIVPAPNTS